MTPQQRRLLNQALEIVDSIQIYGSDTLSGRVDGPDDRDWQRESVNEMTKRSIAALELLQAALAEDAPKKQEPGIFNCRVEENGVYGYVILKTY